MTVNLDDVVGVLRAAGVVVHETANWITTGYAQQDLQQIRGVLWHHTATNRSAFLKSPNPTLNMIKNGRGTPGTPTYLPPPLCNMILDRNGEIWMIATGVANHAGYGIAPGIPRNMGNHYLIGIEMESSGIAPWDWTPAQLKMAPIVGAALEKRYMQNLPPEQRLQLGHKEYSSEGKIDPAGWPGDMDGLRASINKILAAPAPKPPAPPVQKDELNMATVDDFYKKPFARQGPGATGTTNLGATISWMDSNLQNILNRITAADATIKALAGAIAAMSKGEEFDEAKLLASIAATVKTAAAEGVKESIDSIDTDVTVNLKPKE